jgi:hypothetical protein
MAFLGLYLFYWGLIYFVVWRVSGFTLSPRNIGLSCVGGITVIIGLCARLKCLEPEATIIGCALALLAGLYSLRALIRFIGFKKIDLYIRKIVRPFSLQKPYRSEGTAELTVEK